ncbi:MAG: NhaP-type Na+/H+ or K+/H+ antiporter [Bacteroidia bacterium]|jgi:NhaP-type Na+/H+ or K+/H+ antiporter
MHIPDILMLSTIGLLGLLCQWFAWRVKLPAILFLLVVGILIGPVSGFLKPDQLFDDLLFSFISLSVAIILFEGSLTLKRSEFSEVGDVVQKLVSYGAILNALITTVATHYLTGLSWSLSALFGAIMVVTGPTVIMPMLRTVKPNALLARTLRWESIVIDPLGALFAVLVFEWIIAQETSSDLVHVFTVFAQTIATGVLLGVAVGYGFGLLLRHRLLPDYLQNFAAIAFVTSTFALSNTLMHESGLLSVTIMGIWLANMRGVYTRDILNFKESLTLILVSSLFIILSARVEFGGLIALGWGAVGVLLVIQFIARPLKVFLCTLNSNFSRNERLLLAWVGPRGIVAAAITAVFALKLESMQIENAELLVPLAFSVIIGTVVIQSSTARYLTKALGVNAPNTKGYLIIGASPLAVAVGSALKSANINTVLCDTDWDNISAARMAGLNTYYGNAMSDHAELHLDLTALGGMVGLSRNHAVNSSAALRFREDFGPRKIFVLPGVQDQRAHSKHRAGEQYAGRVLLDSQWSYRKLYRLIFRYDAQIKQTQLSEAYQYTQWQDNNDPEEAVPLFALDESELLHWFTEDDELEPQPGWTIYALAKPAEVAVEEAGVPA